MKERFHYAAKEIYQFWRQAIFDNQEGLVNIVLPLSALASVLGGLGFSWNGIGGAGYIINFLVGCASSAIYFLLLYGGYFSFVTLAAFGLYLKHGRSYSNYHLTITDKVVVALALIITVVTAILITDLLGKIPVMGSQMAFMLRDRD